MPTRASVRHPAAVLVLPDPGRTGRGAGGDQHVDVVEDRLDPRRQRRLGGPDLGDLRDRRSAGRVGRSPGCAVRAAPGAAGSARRRRRRATSAAARGRRPPRPDSRGHARPPRGRARAAALPLRRAPLCCAGRPGPATGGGTLALNAIRNRSGLRAAAATNPPSGARSVFVTSRNSAASSTVRHIGPLTLRPHHASSCGASGTRSRCGLMPEQTAPGRRDPDRPGAVGAQRHRRQPGRHRGAAAAAAAARGSGQIPRVAGRAEGHGLGERPQHHLRHRGLAEDHRPGRTQPAHHLGVGGRPTRSQALLP